MFIPGAQVDTPVMYFSNEMDAKFYNKKETKEWK